MKVFLSHSTKDADFVEKLALTLAANEFDVFRCEVDIDKLENFVAKINDGLVQSDICLLIWSPNAAQSAWTKEEWTAAMARQVEGQKMRVGTVLLCDDPAFPIPPLLKTKVWFDARSDQAAAIREAITWLKERLNLQRLSGRKAPVYLPEYRPRDFVGRSAYLARLSGEFAPDPGKFLLFGEPGSGKSTIALRFAWDWQKDLDVVVWQTCGQRPLDAITAELVARLPIDVATLPPDQQRTAARGWLRERPSLLILDDVWSGEVIGLEPKGACSVLYTSRQQFLPGLAPQQIAEVEKFTDAEAEELFHTYLDPVFGNDSVEKNRQPLLDFAARVEMLPIAVAVGASLLRGRKARGLGKAVPRLELEKLTDGAKDVNALFRTAIESQPPREQKLLAACSVCVQEGFWLPLAALIAELAEGDADDAADALVGGSLLRVLDTERRRFQLHALLREQLRAYAGADGVARLQERHASALENLFRDWEKRWPECSECFDEIIPTAGFLWNQDRRGRERQLSFWGYSLTKRIGELDSAFRIAKQEELLWAGRNDREAKRALSASWGNQGRILRRWGQYEKALTLHKQQQAICEELDDKDCLQSSYDNQGVIQRDLGQLEVAMALHREQEDICVKHGIKDGLCRCYGHQAIILYKWGRLDDAMKLHKKEEAICLELDDKNWLQFSWGNQATILQKRGQLEEALDLIEKRETICRDLGNTHDLQRSYGDRALILIKLGRLEEALDYLQKSEAICLELGLRRDLGYRYWHWAWLAGAGGDRTTERQKLQQALALFTELAMPLERDDVQAELDKTNSAS